MMKSAANSPVPKPVPLATKAAAVIRERIRTGVLSGFLPGERDLASSLEISRPTLRLALEQLESEGLIETAHGKPRRIHYQADRSAQPPATSVALVSPLPLERLSAFALFQVDELRQRLAKHGLELEIVNRQCFHLKAPGRDLERAVEGQNIACWILYRVPDAIQAWLADRQVPCVVMGTCRPETGLPFVDVHHRAAVQHAVGVLSRFQHPFPSITLMLPETEVAGHTEIEAGFLEATHGLGQVVRHADQLDFLPRVLDQLWEREARPTALIFNRPSFAIAAMTYLGLRQGRVAPRDYSLICVAHDPALDSVFPRISCYTRYFEMFARKLSRLVLNRAGGHAIRTVENRVIPEYLRGETVDRPRHR